MKEEKLTNWQKILIVLILTGLFYSVFGIRELQRWGREIETKRPRILFQLIFTPLESFSLAAGVEGMVPEAKTAFHEYREIPFDRIMDEYLPETADFITLTGTRWAGNIRRLFNSKEPQDEIKVVQAVPIEAVKSPHSAPATQALTTAPAVSRPSVDQTTEITEEWQAPQDSAAAEEIPGNSAVLSALEGTSLIDETTAPAAESVPAPQPPLTEKIPRGESILLMGDSLANSCGTAFVPLVNRRDDLELVKHGKVSANLSNPVFDEWFEELDQVLEQKHFDIIILMMGANAAQAIVEDGKRWEYGTARWEEIYRERAVNLIHKMKSDGSRIYWVGIPPMLKKSYSAKMVGHNNRISEICREQEISYLPIETVMGNEEGNYLEYKIIGERQVRIRATDGVHYARAGSDILSRHILTTLFPGITF